MKHRRPYLRIIQRGLSLQIEVRGDRGGWEFLSVLVWRRERWWLTETNGEKLRNIPNSAAITLTKIVRQAQDRDELVFTFPFSPWAVQWLKRRKIYPKREGKKEKHRGPRMRSG